MLISPSYGHASKTADHRTHQTIRGLSDRLGVEITADFAKGQEPHLATAVLNSGPDAVLICWEHSHIPALASRCRWSAAPSSRSPGRMTATT